MAEEHDKDSSIVNAARSLGSVAGKLASLTGIVPGSDAISLLKKDHDKVKEIFEAFEKAEDPGAKKALVNQALIELKVHATLEEELFYPAIRDGARDDLINEADEEHHVAKILIAELEGMPSSADHYTAKFTVLAENVRHHIREEENEIFPKARSMANDWDALGQTMQQRKLELLAHGVPSTTEVAEPPGKIKRRKAIRRARKNNAA